MNDGFELVTAEEWKKLIEHVKMKVEDHYWEHDGLYEERSFEFTIQLRESDFDTTDSSSSDDSD